MRYGIKDVVDVTLCSNDDRQIWKGGTLPPKPVLLATVSRDCRNISILSPHGASLELKGCDLGEDFINLMKSTSQPIVDVEMTTMKARKTRPLPKKKRLRKKFWKKNGQCRVIRLNNVKLNIEE